MMEAITACHNAGKGIFSMKAFGGGSLTGHYQEALDYVFSKDEIDSVMIGFGKIAEVDDLLSYLDGSMDKSYNPDISKKKVYINQEDCEGCGACVERCGENALHLEEVSDEESPAYDFSAEFALSGGIEAEDSGKVKLRAVPDDEKCVRCGYCTKVCPVFALKVY